MRKKIYTTCVCIMLFLFGANIALAQQKVVTGVVADKQGISLPGVVVSVAGTSVRTATDSKGKFSISLPLGQNTLVFSFVGMQTLTVKVEPGKNNLQITL